MPKAPSSTPMVSIQRPCYVMASTDGQSADITNVRPDRGHAAHGLVDG